MIARIESSYRNWGGIGLVWLEARFRRLARSSATFFFDERLWSIGKRPVGSIDDQEQMLSQRSHKDDDVK